MATHTEMIDYERGRRASELLGLYDAAVKAAVRAEAATPGTATKRKRDQIAENADAKFRAALSRIA